MRTRLDLIAVPLIIALAVPAMAQDSSIGLTPDQVKWAEIKGLGQAMVLQGDPSKAEAYVVRIKVGPNNVTPPHTHPQAENITVIAGWIGFGLGPVFDQRKGRVLPAGSFFHLPANTSHFAWTGPDGSVIQAHGNGPFP
jgi:quercetin dioxygenase-like cupin family protein